MGYKNRLVIFFDILGWRDHIKKAGNDPEKISRLNQVVTMLSVLKGHDTTGEHQISSFSDNVVMSVPVNIESLHDHFNSIARVQLGMAMMGFLIRGGITIGDIYHNEHAVFGPALVQAHYLESILAYFPRIILDPTNDELNKMHDTIIREENGLRWINPFSSDFLNNLPNIPAASPTTFAKYSSATGIESRHVNILESHVPQLCVTLLKQLESMELEAEEEKAKEKINWFRQELIKSLSAN